MASEIEHKFLVKNDSFKRNASQCFRIRQGYLSRDPDRTVRIRLKGERGFITVKGRNHGAVREEFEYEIPKEDAERMLSMCIPPLLEKTRYIISHEGKIWEVDEFGGSRSGLVTAEVELASEGETYVRPDFIGEDVTGHPEYYNSNL